MTPVHLQNLGYCKFLDVGFDFTLQTLNEFIIFN